MINIVNEGMKMDEILGLIKSLSKSQGFYGRLLRDIEELSSEDYDRLAKELEGQNFQDDLDVVFYFET